MIRATWISVGVLLLTAGVCRARLLENWPYEKLFKEADLVVIAEATAAADSGSTVREKGWGEIDFVGINTTFSVKSTLKGKAEKDTIKVLHFRLKPGVLVQNGPLPVTFRTGRGPQFSTKTGKDGLGKTGNGLLSGGILGWPDPGRGRPDLQ